MHFIPPTSLRQEGTVTRAPTSRRQDRTEGIRRPTKKCAPRVARGTQMRAKLFVLIGAAVVGAPLVAVADVGQPPTAPTSAQERSVDPVVLTGNQFPTWSAGPEIVAHEPGSPGNSSTVGQEANSPQQAQSQCYAPGSNPYDPSDNGDHSCVQDSRLPSENNTVGDAANGALNTDIV